MAVSSPPARRALGIGLLLLAAGLAANSLLGPLALDVIRYRFSDPLVHQGIGLDLVSLAVVAPLAAWAAALVLRGRAAGGAIAMAVGAYAAYMAVQYVVGPEYLELPGNSERFYLLHLALFGLGLGTAAGGWIATDAGSLPPEGDRGAGRWGAILLGIALLLLLRYLPMLAGLTAGDPSFREFRENPTSFVLIMTLDLGVVLPAAIAAGFALRRGRRWARKALHLLVGWLALVGLAVAAMSTAIWTLGDPGATAGQAGGFTLVALVLTGLAVRLHWPLLRGERPASRGNRSTS